MTRFFKYICVFTIILSFWGTYVNAEEAFDPNDKESKTYPDKNKKDKKGTSKYVEFDKKKPKNKKVFDPNEGTSSGYPDANITEIRKNKKSTAKSVIFSDGAVQYPGDYKDPLDNVPMEKKKRAEKREWRISSEDLPKNVCPLNNERRTFNAYNRQNREELFVGMMVGRPYVVLRTKDPDFSKPSILKGGIILESTVFDSARNVWVANINLAPQYKCGSNTVQVHQDDSFTPEISVLDVAEDIVILLVDGKLAYLRPKGSKRPEFRMVWDTGLEVEFEQEAEKPAAKSSKKKTKTKNTGKKRSVKRNAKIKRK